MSDTHEEEVGGKDHTDDELDALPAAGGEEVTEAEAEATAQADEVAAEAAEVTPAPAPKEDPPPASPSLAVPAVSPESSPCQACMHVLLACFPHRRVCARRWC